MKLNSAIDIGSLSYAVLVRAAAAWSAGVGCGGRTAVNRDGRGEGGLSMLLSGSASRVDASLMEASSSS